jgi:ribosomal protein S18 acetylase RimI-like enzyme
LQRDVYLEKIVVARIENTGAVKVLKLKKMSCREISPEWNQQVRDLYAYSNEFLGVSSIFTQRVLEDDLANPADYYSQPGAKLLLWIEPDPQTGEECLVGMVGIVPHDYFTAEIQRLTIHPLHRRKGLGRRLMELAHYTALETLNYQHYIFNCLESNEVALKFYESLPFVRETHRIDHYTHGDQPTYSLVYFESVDTTPVS